MTKEEIDKFCIDNNLSFKEWIDDARTRGMRSVKYYYQFYRKEKVLFEEAVDVTELLSEQQMEDVFKYCMVSDENGKKLLTPIFEIAHTKVSIDGVKNEMAKRKIEIM